MELPWENNWPLHTEIAQQSSLVGGAAATNELSPPPLPRELLPPSSSNCMTLPFIPAAAMSKPPICYRKKRSSENLNSLKAKREKKIIRSGSEIEHHTMLERKRRRRLAHQFIELSATIPGLKKIDKISIIIGAINHVEQLQKRVMELEHENKRGKEPNILLNMASDPNLDNCLGPDELLLPHVKAKVMENNILIYINCEKENGIVLKILNKLGNLHLLVTSTTVLPFGNSTLRITIIAEMGDAYKMKMMDLGDNVRQLLSNDGSTNR
ncbi:transcription factor bHLH25-like isoform X2 [Trifolium pratense]|uniref:transcription factor bHLH25-like isoform X2 n=1 Tax=Trifolium pratense TaxID=57577 RepID=UPI001E691263|nr:transcription factor bHLH25-like isoform X2 [Trifolium pratense]